jgi:hypothetical protein
MTTDEAILYLAIGFMVIIGIWLTALTYLVLKRHRDLLDHEERSLERIHKESHEEEESEIQTPPEDEESESIDD